MSRHEGQLDRGSRASSFAKEDSVMWKKTCSIPHRILRKIGARFTLAKNQEAHLVQKIEFPLIPKAL